MDTSELPVRPLHNPLTGEHKAILDAASERIKIADDMIARAHEAGLDMTQQAERSAMHKHVVGTLLKRFFPTNIHPTDEAPHET